MAVRFLHLLCPGKTQIYPAVHVLAGHFSQEEHAFLAMEGKRWVINHAPRLLAFPAMQYLPNEGETYAERVQRMRWLLPRLEEAEHIVLHSHHAIIDRRMLAIFERRQYWKKCVWIEYGGELDALGKDGREERSRKGLLRKIPYIGLTLPSDEGLVSACVGEGGARFFTPVPLLEARRSEFERASRKKNTEKKPPIVLVEGDHSTAEEHIRTFAQLGEVMKNRLIAATFMKYSIFGERDFYEDAHRKTVYRAAKKKYGIQYYNRKEGNLSLRRYCQSLCMVDIAVYSSVRPLDLQMLFLLLDAGKKVFLPGNGAVYPFLKSQGMDVYPTESIPGMSYEEFILPPEKPTDSPWRQDMVSAQSAAKKWGTLFDAAGAAREIRENAI